MSTASMYPRDRQRLGRCRKTGALMAVLVACDPSIGHSPASTSSTAPGATIQLEAGAAPNARVPESTDEPVVQSPFLAIPDVVPRRVFELEGKLFVQSDGGLSDLTQGAAKPRPELSAGLPNGACDWLSALVGRFPDAAFAFISRVKDECAHGFGFHSTYRWMGSSWSKLPPPQPPARIPDAEGPGLPFGAASGVNISQGPGIVVCSWLGDPGRCVAKYAITPRVTPSLSSPVGRIVLPGLIGPFFRFSPSGTAIAVGESDSFVAVKRWFGSSTSAVTTRVPLPEHCRPAGLYVFSDTDIVIGAFCENDVEARVLRFDGKSFTSVPTPAKAPTVGLSGEPDGTLWLGVADRSASSVYRRSPQGAWSHVLLPIKPLPKDHSPGAKPEPVWPKTLLVQPKGVWVVDGKVYYAPKRAFEE